MAVNISAFRALIGAVYALCCFVTGCLVTANVFHNPLTFAAYIYFAVMSILIGSLAALMIVNERPQTSPPAPQKEALPTKDDA